MVTITLFKIEPLPTKTTIVYRLDDKKVNGCWFKAKESRYDSNEIEIDIWYEEDVEVGVKRTFSDDSYELIQYLKEKGKEKIIRKVYSFVNMKLGTFEIYRGLDSVTYKIKETIEKLLEVNLVTVSLDSKQLLKIVNTHSSELKQAMFKYVHNLWYHILRGNHLEINDKYKEYLETKPESLRVVSVLPKIRYLNGNGYMVTINGDRGTIKLSDGLFKWRPRLEIKQIVSLVASIALSF